MYLQGVSLDADIVCVIQRWLCTWALPIKLRLLEIRRYPKLLSSQLSLSSYPTCMYDGILTGYETNNFSILTQAHLTFVKKQPLRLLKA